jgi:AcrR family transcriptional regulator
MTGTSIRARVRAEMTEQIKDIARRHLAVEGANLSLRAVARDLGVVSSAVYRYFASRDELLTALILDAYDSLGAAVEAADGELSRTDLRGRWLAVCRATREWALAQPHLYGLIYGTPVPGYAAPRDTVGPATRPTLVLGRILTDGVAAGQLAAAPGERLARSVRADLDRAAEFVSPGVPPALVARGMAGWIQLFGAVSFEVFGRLDNVIDDRVGFFELQMRAVADHIGLPRR